MKKTVLMTGTSGYLGKFLSQAVVAQLHGGVKFRILGSL